MEHRVSAEILHELGELVNHERRRAAIHVDRPHV